MPKLILLDLGSSAHAPREAPAAPRVVTAGQVFIVMLLGLLLGALLNADSLLRAAEQRSFDDPNRDRHAAVWQVVRNVSHALLLDKPRNLIRNLSGLESQPPLDTPREETGVITLRDTADGSGTDDGAGPESPATGGRPTATVPVTADAASAYSAAADVGAAIRAPTAKNPLRVWIGGDSMSGTFGDAFRRVAADVGVMVVAPPDTHTSTGLSRPDFFDWPAYLEGNVLSKDYEILILMVGTNDSQSLQQPDGSYCPRFEQCWLDTYRSRVASTMDLLRDAGGNRFVVWVGQPIMGRSSSLHGIEEMNYLYWDEAGKRDWVIYFDSWAYFVDPSGEYAHYLPAADGTEAEIRAQDQDPLHRGPAAIDSLGRS